MILENKVIFITGSTSGIGKETAIKLAKLGALVIVHGRNQTKAEETLTEIKNKASNDNFYALYGDLRSIEEIKNISRQLHKNFGRLDVLINNAGIIKQERTITHEGLEETFAVNYIAPFLLNNLLIDILKNSTPRRIVNVASQVHSNEIDFDNLQYSTGYTAVRAYALSKTCLIMYTYLLADKLKKYNITVNTLHPGVINTKLLKATWGEIGAPTDVGAKALVHAATASDLRNVTGKYFKNNKAAISKDLTYNKQLQEKLWRKTEELLGMKFENF